MGCAQSKPLHRRSAAVALCRDRTKLLAEAIRHRYKLADAHRAYAASLEATGAALHDYLLAAAVVIHDVALPPPSPLPGAAEVLLPPPAHQLTTGGEEEGAEPPEHVVRVPPDEEHDNDKHTVFPSESEEVDDDDDEEGDDGHIQFWSSTDEETEEPPIIPPQDEHLLPKPEHRHPIPQADEDTLRPQPERLLRQPDRPLPQPRRRHPLRQPDHLFLRPGHLPPQAEPLQPDQAPLQMPAPPYTYGPDRHGPAYAYGAEMGTYGSAPASAYGGTDMGTYGSTPAYAYGAEMGAYSPAPAYAYGGAEMGAYSPAPAYAYGGADRGAYSPAPAYAYGAETGTYSPGPPHAYGYGAETGTYGPGPAYSYGAEMGTTYGPAPAYAHDADMGSNYGRHSLVSTMNYARSQPPSPSVAYEHYSPHATNAAVHYYQNDGAFGPPPPSSYYYGGYHYQYPVGESYSPAAPSSLQRAAPLPPPSPPRVSTWDFLNPLETFESYYPVQPAAMANHTPSGIRSSSALSDEDEEGMPELEEDEEEIPELEDEEDMPELEDEKDMPELEEKKDLPEPENKELAEAVGEDECTAVNNGKMANKEEERSSSANEELHKKSGTLPDDGSSGVPSEEPAREGRSLDESLVEGQIEDSAVAAGLPADPDQKTYNDDLEVVYEVKAQFDHASKAAAEVCKLLEVGKVPYNHNCSRLKKVTSRMICGLPSTGKKFLRFEEEKAMECGNLSSTLQKLYMLEKKLLQEVEAEEKLRIMYDQKYKEAKNLFNKGAEAHKLEAVQIHTRKLSTMISIAIKAVKYTSNKINNLRDEELWPQTRELIQGFMKMWHTMLESHQIQCQALSQAKNIGSSTIGAAALFNQAHHIDLVKRLELQLLDMTANFAAWYSAQKSYACTVNEWLKRGINYVPEVTDDGVAPFSPGRLGAPPVFTIYNNWATSIARISEMEVLDTMLAFASSVLGLWERQRSEWMRRQQQQQHQQGVWSSSSSSAAAGGGGQDVGRELRSMTKDELSMRKALQARKKKLRVVGFSSRPPAADAGLHECMRRSFEAMESFAAACATAFKDLHLRSEEEKARPAAQEDGAALP